jgi:phosphate transport system substrate-binding protein
MDKLVRTLLCLSLFFPSGVMAREQLRIVGSSTVFPFVAAAAEQFGRDGKFRTPIVEVNGTGGGFKMFCDGVGDEYPDIANASRPIKDSERARCAEHGVNTISELKIGYDGIVFANARTSKNFLLTKHLIFLALARQVPKEGKLVLNPYSRWREIDPKLPDAPIEVYGPPPAEGTRDAFIEMVMQEACKDIPEYKKEYPDEKTSKQQCGQMREDGRFIELLGGNVMVQKLVNNHDALGIFSYSFLDQNRAVVKANPVAGMLPTISAITRGDYSVSRSLFIYVKSAHVGKSPGLAEFAQFLVSDAAAGDDGFLSVKGLIPLPSEERKQMQMHALNPN